MKTQNDNNSKNTKLEKWFKRVGIGGLAFFTLKGIAWLFVFYYGAELFQGCTGN